MVADSDATAHISDEIPVSRIKPAYEQVADQLRDLIVSGRLLPGDRLPVEAKLSGTFGVSRSTVREALRSLTAQNLVYTSRGVTGGTFVAATTPGLLSSHLETGLSLLTGTDAITADELLEAREFFEVPAARLAAQRRTQEHIDKMRVAIERESRASGRGAKFERNTQFHTLVLSAAGNKLVEVMTVPIFGVIRSRFLRDDAPRRFWSQVDDDHLAILGHIEAGAGDAAMEAMRDHLARLRETYQAGGREE
ncbi:MAG TPA: FadR/GntR family transcriptional regulator [Streptosporangiaceae bacterium]|nr:FadR/GntR family transcriptional regulator [Streptosporangiaceae bacterium]